VVTAETDKFRIARFCMLLFLVTTTTLCLIESLKVDTRAFLCCEFLKYFDDVDWAAGIATKLIKVLLWQFLKDRFWELVLTWSNTRKIGQLSEN